MVMTVRAFACVTVLGTLCWPVSAQSQTPTNAYPSPYYPSTGGQYGSGYGNNYGGGYGNQQGGLNSPLGTSLGGGRTGLGSTGDTTGQGQGGMGGQGTGSLRDRHKKDRSTRKGKEGAAATTPGDNKGKAPAPRGGAVGKAAADAGPGKDASKPASASAGAKGGAKGGGGGGGGGTTYTKGEPGTVSVAGEGAFEPILERDITYGEVPEEGEPITLEGPIVVGEFLSAINLATNWNILVSPDLKDVELKFWISETTPKKALEILKFYKIYYEYEPDTKYLRVMSEEEHQKRLYGKRQPKEFRVKNIDVTFAESMVSALLSSTGRTITDQRSGVIYVWDTEDNIKEMDRIIEQIDTPLERAQFKIKHADVPDIESVVTALLSPNGNIMTDTRTGQLFVWDAPSNLKQVRMAVESLDKPVESKTFELKQVNAEDVTDNIESLLTERGTVQVDPRTNTIIVTDLPTRLEHVAEVVKTLDKELETRSWAIKYADLDFIADQIESLIPSQMGSIVVNDQVNQVTATGVSSRLDEIDKLIKTWDIKRKQVHIESFIVEVSNDIERSFSINWSYFSQLSGQPFGIQSGKGGVVGPTSSTTTTSTGTGTGTGSTTTTTSSPLPGSTGPGSGEAMQVGQLPYAVPLYGALQLDSAGKIVRPQLFGLNGKPLIDRYVGNKLSATLDYLDKQSKINILSSPRVTVQDGEEAMFQNASRVPYVSASTYYGGGYGGGYGGYGGTSASSLYGATNNTNRVEFIDVGTILTVLPRIADDDTILMDISAEDSTYVDKTLTVNDQKSTVPEKTVRRADTQVRVNTGDTVVLGGLRKDRSSKSMTKTPFLGDLPVLGWLFRSPDKLTSNASLLIFITPTIVDESTSMEAVDLMQVDEEMGKDVRHLKKDIWGRIQDNVTKGKNEIVVSIGANGRLSSDGKVVTVEELGKTLQNVKKPKSTSLVIRRHPTAPLDVVNSVMEAAMEANIHVENEDGGSPPIVPSMSSVEEKAVAVDASAKAPPATAVTDAKDVSPVTPAEGKQAPAEAIPPPKEEKAPEAPPQSAQETKAP